MIYNPYTPQNQDRTDEWTDSELNAPDEDNETWHYTPPEEEWPDEPGDEQCQDIFQQVEQAPLRKPLGKCVTEIAPDGVHWRL